MINNEHEIVSMIKHFLLGTLITSQILTALNQEAYSSYFSSAFPRFYESVRSVDPKYLAIGGALLGISATSLAYLRNVYGSNEKLVEKITKYGEKDFRYFAPRSNFFNWFTVWDNPAVRQAYNEGLRNKGSLYEQMHQVTWDDNEYGLTVSKSAGSRDITVLVTNSLRKAQPKASWDSKNNQWALE